MAPLADKEPKHRHARLQKEALALIFEEGLWKAQFDFKSYIKIMKPDYKFEWSHLAVIETLEKFLFSRDPSFRKVMILAPPTWGKSELSSRLFPTFAFGRMSARVLKGSTNPFEVILASYGDSLGKEFVNHQVAYCEKPEWRKIFRNVCLSPRGGGLGTQFSRTDARLDFVCDAGKKDFAQGGGGDYRKSAGLRMIGRNGSITGKHADLIILDDMVKGQAEAISHRIKEETWAWWNSTLSTRLKEGGKILAVNTRWAEDDLAGRLEKSGEWHVIKLPAKAYAETDPDRASFDKRKKGQLLSPRRKQKYEEAEKNMPESDFAALFQQKPAAESGNIIKGSDIQYWKGADFPATDMKIISVDLSIGKDKDPEHKTRRKERSFTVMELWGMKTDSSKTPSEEFYLLDQVRDQMDFTDQEIALIEFAEEHLDASKVCIEQAANAEGIYSRVQSRIPGLELIPPKTEKAFRLKAVKRFYKKKQVFYPDPQEYPWVDVNISEITRFPKAAHDDTVDTASLALKILGDEAEVDAWWD